ncbi:bifunctional 2-polyprenyl-6-hydroxyphenol methylase/3-demethylubiquinol 3-O-methyltransferase UbiG [Acinetobacter nectaris]|uniref:bifunctional 2-polyprenyl-6-hydroxyphenol methylase/3-demethylubiquinol 3-O-methyltransferase UbiG n=1 Tax=Acinetobacter nectaris TaxID=1219382 RepID=UPI001EFFCF30|nr:bifunctional 2-polyprenyl-6-hydroxyphenol methylase/3-demethylubiquinol 3-O-methyltransferase UbiG [Acinetobacter nectaris]MCF8998400.1 bifunctional 2-polyprenyl-6-hydroxyphenol methylase/3-demethylubiquinol 3-O-methyltransferase UbiG [Acinetobacter nectaris]MCF9028405.1 bifunctional 2-polyprenyl-6-hydroxyphenol methylase/3-demethylubiquinol 3-O-methyltransferase UbiG [Acinetobacter nectaris]MCF9033730.1 bifunctional 2-polyprenyl-6-hydroxyphenol methylase/3-demethylubiquinol 3-O-methyltransfe
MTQLNVDPQEIAKFEALAEKWWDKTSEFRPLHEINPLRLNWIDEYSEGIEGKKIIDVGCGGGILAESMARRGASVLGIDMGEAPLNVARLHAEKHDVKNIEYKQVPVEQLAEEQAGQYDIVTCMEMLEHVPNPASIIQACQKLVKPGGHVFFSTINRNPKSYLFAIIGAEYVLRLLPKGTHDYHKFIRPSELAYDIRAANLELKNMIGLHYNPLTKHYWLAPNIDVNYMVHTQDKGEV